MKVRSVASVIIFTLLSCGIYGLVWIYMISKEIQDEVGPGKFDPAVLLILCLFTGGIGYLLFGMEMNEDLNKLREKYGLAAVDNGVVYMLLGFFIPIVLVGLVQSEVNKLCDADI